MADEIMNVSLAEAITMSVDDLIIKACANEKGQKGLVKRLATTQKDEVLEEISTESAIKAITSPVFISSVDGRKLARHFIKKIGIVSSWDKIIKLIKSANASKFYCYYVGQVLMDLWKKLNRALEEELAQEEDDARQTLETDLFAEIFNNSILLEKQHAEKFLNMLNGMVEQRNSAGSQMLTRVASELLWRALEAPNGKVRFNAANVFFVLYPMSNPDVDLGYNIQQKEHKRFQALLMDDCVLTRINAIKKIMKIMALSWHGMKQSFAKEYLTTIVDKLSKDDASEVRLVIFVCLPLLLDTKTLHPVIEHALKIVGPQGLIDPKLKNRIAAVRMLLQAESKLSKHVHEIIGLDVLVECLDIEVDADVQLDLVKLIFPCMEAILKQEDIYAALNDEDTLKLFSRKMSAISKASRNGALKFFSRLPRLEVLTPEEISKVISSFIVLILTMLNATQGVNFKRVQTIIDCIFVLFNSSQSMLMAEKTGEFYSTVVNALLNLIEFILEHEVYSNSVLAESALTAASFISESNVINYKQGYLLETVKEGMQNSPVNSHKLSMFIQTFAMWNLKDFCVVVEKGFYEIAMKLRLNHLVPKEDQRLIKGNISGDKSKDSMKKPILFLWTALNGPSGQILRKEYASDLDKYNTFLKEFLKVIPELTTGSEEEDFWLRVYELHTGVSIICFNDKKEMNAGDTFHQEIEWFENRFDTGMFTPKFVLNFMNCAVHYFETGQQKLFTCNLATDLLNKLMKYAENHKKGQDMTKLICMFTKAVIEATSFSKMDPDLSAIHEEEEPMVLRDADENDHQDIVL